MRLLYLLQSLSTDQSNSCGRDSGVGAVDSGIKESESGAYDILSFTSAIIICRT